jgi:hypothetical protein
MKKIKIVEIEKQTLFLENDDSLCWKTKKKSKREKLIVALLK